MHQFFGKDVGPVGFGLMGFTWRPNPCSEEQAFEAMRAALQNGCNCWNGGEIYGTPEYNSMTLLERYFKKYPEDADKVVLSIKGGINLKLFKADGSPEGIRTSLDNILGQLKGSKKVDMFECARRDPNTPLSVTFGTIEKEYIQTGKVGGISLSECSVATLEEAVATTKVVAVEVELSLWSTEILTNGIAEACAKHGIPIIAYSPLGRGMLTGQIKSYEDFPEGDFRREYPRFQPEVFDINIKLVKQLEAMAEKKGCTPSQLAIGWCIALSRKPGMPTIIPIPGATTAAKVNENSRPANLTDEEMAEIDATLAKFEVLGKRYPDHIPVDT